MNQASRSRFVILSTQRTGSTWLTDMLSNHPAVVAYTELFLQHGKGIPTWSREQDFLYWNTWVEGQPATRRLFRPGLVFKYLDELYELHPEAQATGFKLMYTQGMKMPEAMAYLRLKKVRIIHLVRANLLDVVMSEEIMKHRGFAHSRDTIDKPRIEINVDYVMNRLKRKSRNLKIARQVIAKLGVPVLELRYESLRSDTGIMSDVWAFLGVESYVTESTLKKGAPDSLRETILNYDELSSALSDSPFAAMLH